MTKSNRIQQIIDDLKERLQTAEIYDQKLEPAIMSYAETRDLLDRLNDKLTKEGITMVEMGSQGQTKRVVNPLVPQIKDLQKILSQKLTELGLTYQTTPSKMPDAGQKDTSLDRLAALMEGSKPQQR